MSWDKELQAHLKGVQPFLSMEICPWAKELDRFNSFNEFKILSGDPVI